jgi:hypothetical protein
MDLPLIPGICVFDGKPITHEMKNLILLRLFITLCVLYCPLAEAAGQVASGIINTYHRVTAINTTTNWLTLNSTAGLSINTRVLLIQMKGAEIDNSNSVNFGNITQLNGAGNYEFNYICAIAGNEVLMSQQLARNYDVNEQVQLVSVPRYNEVTVGGHLTGQPWNSITGTGGVIALEAQTIYLNGDISANGIGFAGGWLQDYPNGGYDCTPLINVTNFFLPLMAPGGPQYTSAAPKGEGIAAYITGAEYARGKQANGGGGGNNHNAGGGGGANYGAGGLGGRRSLEPVYLCHGGSPGLGGLSLASFGYSATTNENRVFMGGGGGAGHENNGVGLPGGAGGGIIFITANTIVSAGRRIEADGARPFNPAHAADPYSAGGDGGGGGGAGGTIILNVNSVTGSIIASAAGARGSDAARTGTSDDCPGSGGGGGGGVVWMKGAGSLANVTSFVNGGANGVGSPNSPNTACRNTTAGATAGGNGAVLTGFILPDHTAANICEPLPVNELKSFTGRTTANGNELKWELHSRNDIVSFELERTIDHVRYATVANLPASANLVYLALDVSPEASTCYYRLKVIRANSKIEYSEVIRINSNLIAQFQWLSMQPNPASDNVSIRLYSKENFRVNVILLNSAGQPLSRQQKTVSPGFTDITIPIQPLPAGNYWVLVEANGIRTVKSLMKH